MSFPQSSENGIKLLVPLVYSFAVFRLNIGSLYTVLIQSCPHQILHGSRMDTESTRSTSYKNPPVMRDGLQYGSKNPGSKKLLCGNWSLIYLNRTRLSLALSLIEIFRSVAVTIPSTDLNAEDGMDRLLAKVGRELQEGKC